jgi:hypothetical protein
VVTAAVAEEVEQVPLVVPAQAMQVVQVVQERYQRS